MDLSFDKLQASGFSENDGNFTRTLTEDDLTIARASGGADDDSALISGGATRHLPKSVTIIVPSGKTLVLNNDGGKKAALGFSKTTNQESDPSSVFTIDGNLKIHHDGGSLSIDEGELFTGTEASKVSEIKITGDLDITQSNLKFDDPHSTWRPQAAISMTEGNLTVGGKTTISTDVSGNSLSVVSMRLGDSRSGGREAGNRLYTFGDIEIQQLKYRVPGRLQIQPLLV